MTIVLTGNISVSGQVVQQYTSKKNRVYRIRPALTCFSGDIVLKSFSAREALARETEVLRILAGKIRVPKILAQLDNCLLLEYLPGTNLAEWLETEENSNCQELAGSVKNRMTELAIWLKGFYQVMAATTGRPMRLGDVNLRNFIVHDALAAVDFEDVQPGNPEEDLGKIAAFVLKYRPENTPWKQQLARFWLAISAELFDVGMEALTREMVRELDLMKIRRNSAEL